MPKWFKLSEFTCPCGCGLNNIHPTLVSLLDAARTEAGIPFVLTCGSRCPTHNHAVGGSPTSSHLTGLAVDILCRASTTRWKVVTSLLSAGFRRIEIGPYHIHTDIDGDKPQDVIFLPNNNP